MGQFDALDTAQADEIEVAVRNILRADEELAAYFTGGIVRPATPMDGMDLDFPWCQVCVPALAPEFQFQEESEVRCTVRILMVWQEMGAGRARDIGTENTVKSLVRQVFVALWANQLLQVDEEGELDLDASILVDRLKEFREVAFGKYYQPGEETDGDTPYRFVDVEVIYEHTLDLVTGNPPA